VRNLFYFPLAAPPPAKQPGKLGSARRGALTARRPDGSLLYPVGNFLCLRPELGLSCDFCPDMIGNQGKSILIGGKTLFLNGKLGEFNTILGKLPKIRGKERALIHNLGELSLDAHRSLQSPNMRAPTVCVYLVRTACGPNQFVTTRGAPNPKPQLAATEQHPCRRRRTC